MTSLSHIATARLAVPARAAFDFLADPIRLGRWSLGCMDAEPTDAPELYMGRSLFDESPTWFHIEAEPASWRIVYHVGTRASRRPRIAAQIVPAEVCDLPSGVCYASLIAWRTADMDDERWHRLCVTHETEILLIRSQCERLIAKAGPASSR